MHHRLIFLSLVLPLGLPPSIAAVTPVADPAYTDRASGDLDAWQRIAFQPRDTLKGAPQIKVAIETGGPNMQGLVRLPGGLASNFDTGRGRTVVDLINPGDDARGYAEIVAIEIAFTQSVRGQVFRVVAADD